MTPDRNPNSPTATANQMPISLAAATFLKKTEWGINPEQPIVTSLMQWGLENGIRTLEMAEPIDWMLRLEKARGPVGMVKLITGSLGGEENLTGADLLAEETPLDAAAMLLENLIMNYRAGL